MISPGTPEAGRWAYLLNRYHYLGLRVVGENLGYLAYERSGREIACLLFGAPAWCCRARNAYLNWTSEQRAAQLSRLANNTRFLVLPWMRVAHLASHLLGRIASRISEDWQEAKSAVIYRLEQSIKKASGRGLLVQKYVVASRPETTGVDFGAAVQAEALQGHDEIH